MNEAQPGYIICWVPSMCTAKIETCLVDGRSELEALEVTKDIVGH